MKLSNILLGTFLFLTLSGKAQNSSALAGTFSVNTQNGNTSVISIQPYVSLNTADKGVVVGWFPFLFSGMSTNVTDIILTEEIQLSPNPARHEIIIQSADKGNSIWQITLHDLNGKLLKKQAWEEHQQELELDISPLPVGTFFLLFYDPVSSNYRLEKFIKID